ncbi:MAG: hypothetical protein HOP29_05705 [Phycisphaerales bacterium]|nr:hypothetical protein [Phycisphaerales bacterium]
MPERNRSSTGGVRMAAISSPAWVLVGMCMAVGASPARGQCVEQQKLAALDAAANDFFGYAVSVSGDTAVVGAIGDNHAGGIDAGSAYVYVRSGGVWTQQQKLTALDAAAGDNFGVSVSVSGDTIVVGAIFDDDAGRDSGSAYVFVRTGVVWNQQQKLTASDATASDWFGAAVSVNGDTVVVGAYADDHAGGSDAGSAYVFVRSGVVWNQQQKLTAADAAESDEFGYTVSVSGDTAVVGAELDDDAGASSGSAYVFVRSGTVWTPQQKLTAPDAAPGDQFGISVSAGGDLALIGAYRDDDAGSASGSAYVFVRSGAVWTPQQKLTASDAAAGDEFGFSVSVSGSAAVVGAYADDDAGMDSGSAYVFVRSAGVWAQQQKLTAADAAAGDLFGISVSVSGDAAVVGAYLDADVRSFAGSTYAFGCAFAAPCDGDDDCDDDDVCTQDVCAAASCGNPSRQFGDANHDGSIDIFDILCVLDGFAGVFSVCALPNVDLTPCPGGDGIIDVFDILAVLDGFAGVNACNCPAGP